MVQKLEQPVCSQTMSTVVHLNATVSEVFGNEQSKKKQKNFYIRKILGVSETVEVAPNIIQGTVSHAKEIGTKIKKDGQGDQSPTQDSGNNNKGLKSLDKMQETDSELMFITLTNETVREKCRPTKVINTFAVFPDFECNHRETETSNYEQQDQMQESLNLKALAPTKTKLERIFQTLGSDVFQISLGYEPALGSFHKNICNVKNISKEDHSTTQGSGKSHNVIKDQVNPGRMSATDTEFRSSFSQNMNTQSLTRGYTVLPYLTEKIPTSQLNKTLSTASQKVSNSLRDRCSTEQKKRMNQGTKKKILLKERKKCISGKLRQNMSLTCLKQTAGRKLLILLLLMCVSRTKTQNCRVFWDISTTVNIGKDLTLKCEFQADDPSKCIGLPKWEGGPARQIISLDNEVLPDSGKYAINIGTREYDLIIRNVTEEDLNSPYTCHKKFQSYTAVLKEKLSTQRFTTTILSENAAPVDDIYNNNYDTKTKANQHTTKTEYIILLVVFGAICMIVLIGCIRYWTNVKPEKILNRYLPAGLDEHHI